MSLNVMSLGFLITTRNTKPKGKKRKEVLGNKINSGTSAEKKYFRREWE